MGFGACCVGLSGFYGVGALYMSIKELPWEKNGAKNVLLRSSPLSLLLHLSRT